MRGFTIKAGWRWVVALGAILLLAALGELTRSALDQPRRLGIEAATRVDHLVIQRVEPGSPPWDAGVRVGDMVVAVGGRAPVDSDTSTLHRASEFQVQTRSGVIHTAPAGPLPLPSSPIQQVSFALLALALTLVGVTVFVLATDVATSARLLTLTLAASVLIVAGSAEESGAAWAYILTYVAVVVFGAATLMLFLNFPVSRLGHPQARTVALACDLAHGALLVGYAWVWLVHNNGYEWLQKATYGVVSADLLGAIALLGWSAVRHNSYDRRAQQALRFLVPGAIAAFAPFALLSLLPQLLGLGYAVTPDITFLTVVFLPASVGGTVLARQWPGVDRLMRRGLVALAVWITLLAAYSVLLYAPEYLFERPEFPDYAMIAGPLFVVFVAGTFPFAQHFLRRRLDQALFHDVYNYPDTLREMSHELSQLSRGRFIASYALNQLGTILDLSWAAVLSLRPNGSAFWVWRPRPAEFREQNGATEAASSEWAELEATAAASVALASEDEPLGTLLIGPKRHDLELLEQDRSLLVTLGPMLSTAFLNARLLRQREERLRELAAREQELAALSLRLMHSQEEERARLALELHDDPLQRAWLLARELGAANGTGDAPRWRRAAEDIAHSLNALAVGLRPPALTDLGLAVALQNMLDEAGAASEISGSLEVRTAGRQPFGRLEPDLELALYRVAQEALNNCLKYSEANHVHAILNRSDRSVRLSINDDGKGFDPTNEGGPSHHLGIVGMRERLRPWNGSLTVKRGRAGGTSVLAQIPLGGVETQVSDGQVIDEGEMGPPHAFNNRARNA